VAVRSRKQLPEFDSQKKVVLVVGVPAVRQAQQVLQGQGRPSGLEAAPQPTGSRRSHFVVMGGEGGEGGCGGGGGELGGG
jgi:hypothetical protein